MSWIFRKIFRYGPFRTTLSKGGMGMSFGIPGCRVGVSPLGRKYISFGIPGTGFYFIKYLSNNQSITNRQQPTDKVKQSQNTENEQNAEPWWKQKNL